VQKAQYTACRLWFVTAIPEGGGGARSPGYIYMIVIRFIYRVFSNIHNWIRASDRIMCELTQFSKKELHYIELKKAERYPQE
jgi:hypothetical protein